MITTKHTPGPWEAFDHAGSNMRSYSQSSGVTGTGEHDKQLICGCFNDIGGDGIASANACLIAAAPELLKALEAVMSFYRNEITMGSEKVAALGMAEAAIQKATKESTR